MARRVLAAASFAALTLCTTTLVVDGGGALASPGTWGVPLGYAATMPAAQPDPDGGGEEAEARSDDDGITSATRRQSGGPDAVRIPDLLGPLLPDTGSSDERPAQAPDDSDDDAPAEDTRPEPRDGPLRNLANLLFNSDFENGLGDWGTHDDGSIEVVNSPVREGTSAVRLTAQDNGGGNVRTQLDGPMMFDEGDDAYIGFSSYFPKDNPEVNGWFVFFEFHGPPFNGSPLPGAFGIQNRDGEERIKFGRSEKYDYDVPWTMPLVKGEWNDFVLHVKFSKDEDTGFIELWANGERQRFTDGSERLYQSTIMSDQDEGLYPIATNYYEAGTIDGPISVYHDAIRVATTYADAAPGGR